MVLIEQCDINSKAQRWFERSAPNTAYLYIAYKIQQDRFDSAHSKATIHVNSLIHSPISPNKT